MNCSWATFQEQANRTSISPTHASAWRSPVPALKSAYQYNFGLWDHASIEHALLEAGFVGVSLMLEVGQGRYRRAAGPEMGRDHGTGVVIGWSD